MTFDQYPNISKMTLMIARDNGVLNRTTTKERVLKSLEPVLEEYLSAEADQVKHLEDVLGKMSPEELDIFSDGEHQEILDIVEKYQCAVGSDLLNDLFDAM